MNTKITPITLLPIVFWAICLHTGLPARGGSYAPQFAFGQKSSISIAAEFVPHSSIATSNQTRLNSADFLDPAFPTELIPKGKPINAVDHDKKMPYATSTSPSKMTEVAELSCNYNAQKICLQWITPCEHDISQFIVKRTTDGVNFTKVGVVASQGNSLEPHHYEMVDADPVNGQAYYCLFSSNLHDQTTCWGFVEAQVNEQPVLHISANPGIQEKMTLELNFLQGSSVNWILLDTDGTLIDQGLDHPLQFGSLQMKMADLPKLKPGLYFLQIQNEKSTFTSKIIITGHA